MFSTSAFSDFGAKLKSDLDSIKNDILGIKSGIQQKAGASALPWKTQAESSRFYRSIDVKPERWNQLFPYRLLVIDTSSKGQGKIVGGNQKPSQVSVLAGESGTAILNFQGVGPQWIFNLPISPQQLSISDQYAITTSATLRGVLEEHGGLKFKNITASGTLGVWPFRSSVTKPPSSPGIIKSLFGSTIEAAGNLIQQAGRVVNSLTSNHPANKPTTTTPELSDAGATSTGYYQAIALQQFLEQYAEAKKNPANAGWRLVFDIPKQNQSLIVTPVAFAWQQSANKPLEINYTFQLKAWRRINLDVPVVASKPEAYSISPGLLQAILNTVTEARRTVSASVNLIGAVRSDVTKPIEVLRQTSLFIKDLSGAATTAADLPSQIISDYSSAIRESVLNYQSAIGNSSDASVKNSLNSIVASSKGSEGLSSAAVANGQLGSQAAIAQSTDPSNAIFSDPEKNFDILDQVPVSNLTLTAAQQEKIDQIIEDARNTTIDDLKQYRATIQDLALQLSNNFGAGSSYYNQIYGRPAPTTRIQGMTLDEYDILKSLYDVIQSYDNLTATTDVDFDNKQTNMEYVAGLADQAGIPFNISNSKVYAPVPFGLSIEQISLRYLGDAQRWIEIATLNNLRDPYIDENGFKLTLLSNATGRQINVSSIENLYIGQRVILLSSTQSQVVRYILGIDRLSDTNFLLTLDGEPDLDVFLIADSAYLQAYLPGTVNSQQKIFIPSDLAPQDLPDIPPPSSTQGDPLVGLSQVDWLLTDSGDLAINNYGDFRYSAGLTNLIQALRIKIGTVKGKSVLHPDFGLGLQPGIASSELSAQDIYDSINKLITDDPRFDGVNNLQVSMNGPTLSIGMEVSLANQSGVFPLTFELKT